MTTALPEEKNHLGYLYSLTVFASSAMLLALEIVAGRLLAPYVGVSLYTWTSIIGVILAGLSLGNWWGGVMAEKGYGHRATGFFLLASSLTSVLVLPLLVGVGNSQALRNMNLISASFFYVLILFFLPAVLLGVIAPLVTTLYLRISDRTGRIVGQMHALATFGSIIGTFATGLVLIQWLGTRSIVLLIGIILLLLAIPYFFLGPRYKANILSSVVIFTALISFTYGINGLTSPCNKESSFYCLRVVDERDGNNQTFARTLILDHMVHSTNVVNNPGLLITPYIQVMDALIDQRFPDRSNLRYFFAGGGAYTHPRSVAYRFPHSDIVVSEIDPVVTALAEDALFLDASGMEIHHRDTRKVIEQYEGSAFDVIVTDVFHDVGIPFHLTTQEYVKLVSTKLADHGLYLANVIDVFPDNNLVAAMLHTLQQEFSYVGVWIAPPAQEETRLTFVLTASNKPFAVETIMIDSPQDSQWYQINEFVQTQVKKKRSPLLTDNFAPVERLLGKLLASDAGI
ncbi:MAG: fused MFS/spermidine synthase [Acidiferrobacterales bacterium]|nr:fused MFS/spermidine synthase [Acidiferrobacterales bacterium]